MSRSLEKGADRIERLVAVLVIVVTLLGAVFAFLQTQAGNREDAAGRRAQVSSVRAMAGTVDAARKVDRDARAYDLWDDHDWLESSFGLDADSGGPEAPYLRALTKAQRDAKMEIAPHSQMLARGVYRDKEDGAPDWASFLVDQSRPALSAAEFEKANAAERDAWSRKSSEYVTVITVFAVSLFLLGLSLTVKGNARRAFLGIGAVVALLGATWGVSIWVRAVEKPAAAAIASYVDGQAALEAADTPKEYRVALRHFTEAVERRPDYADAYLSRGGVHLRLDMLRPGGPEGSEAALADYERASELGADDGPTLGSIGAAQWWLGDYEAAAESTRRALATDPDDITLNLNYGEALNLTAPGEQYRKHLRRIRTVLAEAPAWLRDSEVESFYEAIDLAVRYRPDVAEAERAFRDDLREIHQEIVVSQELFGRPDPKPVEAELSELDFVLSPDRTELDVEFDYEGMKPAHSWLYNTYVDGEKVDWMSGKFSRWRFTVPDGGLVIPLTDSDGFRAGDLVRAELFVDGNLLAAGEYTIPAS